MKFSISMLRIPFKTYAAISLVVVLVIAIALFAFGLPGSFLVGYLQSQIEAKTDFKLRILGATSLALLPSPSLLMKKLSLSVGDRSEERFTAEQVRVTVALFSLLRGRPEISEISIVRPTIRVPLVRRRAPSARAASDSAAAPDAALPVAIESVEIDDGTVIMMQDGRETGARIDHLRARASWTKAGLSVALEADWDNQKVRFATKARISPQATDLTTIPAELAFEAPGLLRGAVTADASVKIARSLFSINGINGTIGPHRFNGWVSVDTSAQKPMVKADLDLRQLDFVINRAPNSGGGGAPLAITDPWSDRELDVDGLNFVDAAVRISATELNVGQSRFAPIELEATLDGGALEISFPRVGAYDGTVDGVLRIDASRVSVQNEFQVNLRGVRALPLLSDVAEFTALDGRLDASFDLRGRGQSQRAIASSLKGIADLQFRDGEIRSVNIAQMIRSLATNPLDGWQSTPAAKTDFSELSFQFRIFDGQAKTENLRIIGPLVRVSGLGIVDLAGKTLDFKIEPKLVASLEGQGGKTDLAGFGVPVAVRGSWNEPKIYPDIAGILDNPDAAYETLRKLGLNLFGGGGGQQPGIVPDPIAKGIEGLIDRFSPNRLKPPSTDMPSPKTEVKPEVKPDEPRRPESQALDLLREFLGR